MRSFIVSQHGKYLFTVHARSVQHAHAIIAVRLSDLTAVRIVAGKSENFSDLELPR